VRERILFMDRDGTLNRSLGRRPPNSPDEVELLPNVGPVLERYAGEGWRLVIVTNQGGVAQGFLSEAQAQAVLQRTIDLLPVAVDGAHLCPHMARARLPRYALDCPNRKPRPGFILQELERFATRPEDCLFVGDSLTDRQAAEAAKVPFYWADTFFSRPIARGMRTRKGHWFQVREVSFGTDGPVRLVALVRGKEVGAVELVVPADGEPEQLSQVHVSAVRERAQIEDALREAAEDWLARSG
jgi:D-glycero-D-manno-heptose 1,7-bisphosphate phosphatase